MVFIFVSDFQSEKFPVFLFTQGDTLGYVLPNLSGCVLFISKYSPIKQLKNNPFLQGEIGLYNGSDVQFTDDKFNKMTG